MKLTNTAGCKHSSLVVRRQILPVQVPEAHEYFSAQKCKYTVIILISAMHIFRAILNQQQSDYTVNKKCHMTSIFEVVNELVSFCVKNDLFILTAKMHARWHFLVITVSFSAHFRDVGLKFTALQLLSLH